LLGCKSQSIGGYLRAPRLAALHRNADHWSSEQCGGVTTNARVESAELATNINGRLNWQARAQAMTMQLVCPQCHKVLEISGAPPAFCAYCGQSLTTSTVTIPAPSTGEFDVHASTLPPRDTVVAPSRLIVPKIVGKYRLLGRLGSGGMGTVFEAE